MGHGYMYECKWEAGLVRSEAKPEGDWPEADCITTNMRGYFIFLQVSDSFVMFGTWFVNLIKYKIGISSG